MVCLEISPTSDPYNVHTVHFLPNRHEDVFSVFLNRVLPRLLKSEIPTSVYFISSSSCMDTKCRQIGECRLMENAFFYNSLLFIGLLTLNLDYF